MTGIVSPWHHDQMVAWVTPVDQAFAASERKWGVGRLECLVSAATLLSYRRGWELWRAALQDGDVAAMQEVGPKMIAALAYMDQEATVAGHSPLAVESWEALLPDGRVLVVVHSNAEASAIARAANLGADALLPPDLAQLIRHQHEGRHLVVWTMAELARVLPQLDLVNEIKRTWIGAAVEPVRVTKEGDAMDWARADPFRAELEGAA